MGIQPRYLLHYEPQPYKAPEPWLLDEGFLAARLLNTDLFPVGEYDYYVKPHRTLTRAEIAELLADQVLESLDGGDWRDITARAETA